MSLTAIEPIHTTSTQEVGSVEALNIRVVVVARVISVHKLANVVGLVACGLHPDREPVVVEPILNEDRIPTC